MGIAAESREVGLLARHLSLVYEANEALNLTSIPASDAVALHVLDSCAALPFLDRAPAGRFADLGSGAGYPAIPLAVLSGRTVDLVESVGKKAHFLEHVVQTLCLEATVRPLRAEELAEQCPRGFAAVTARALSALPSLVELAAPLLEREGWLVCLKGRPDADELRRGDLAGGLCGLRRIDTASIEVPGADVARTVVLYRSVGPSKVALPRRNGMAQRKPLA
jgi:16S rRNA (guanine527-N7)-methyltransferase